MVLPNNFDPLDPTHNQGSMMWPLLGAVALQLALVVMMVFIVLAAVHE